MKIRTKFILYFLAIACFALLCVMVDSFYNIDKVIISNAKNNLGAIAEIQQARIEQVADEETMLQRQIAGRSGIVDALAAYNAKHDDSDKTLLLTKVQDAKTSVSDFINIAILDTQGNVIVSADAMTKIDSFYDPTVMVKELDQEKIGISINASSDKKVVIQGPIKQSGKIIGTLVILASKDDLTTIMSDHTGLGSTGETTIASRLANGDAQFVENPRFSDGTQSLVVPKSKTDVAIIKALNKNEALDTSGIDYRNHGVYAVTKYIPSLDWGMVVKIDKAELYQPIYSHALQLGLIGLAILLTSAIASIVIAKKFAGPIEELQVSAEEIAKGDLSRNVVLKSTDEVGQLSRSFDVMMKAILASRANVDIKVKEQTKEIIEKQADMENQQKAILNILEDVELEKELTAREKDKINAILQSIGDAVFVVDKNKTIVIVNTVTANLSGYTKEELVGKKYSDVLKFVHEDTGLVNSIFMDKAFETKTVQEMSNHTVIVNKNGEQIPVSDSAAPLLDEAGNVQGCVVVFRDVTKERQVDKAKTEFVSLASHQLRTPLSAVNWYAEMLENGDAGELNEQQKQFVTEIYKGNQRMVGLVNSLLNVSRIELGTFIIEPEPTDLVAMAKDVVKEMTPLISERKLQVIETYVPDLPTINVDPKLTRIVVQNLLSNAVKYTPQGQVALTIGKDTTNVLITVADTGMGIPMPQQAKVFQKLFRADNVRKTETEGTGLGLYLVKSVLESTGGSVRFESVENKGTTFFVTIPLSGMKKKEGTKTID